MFYTHNGGVLISPLLIFRSHALSVLLKIEVQTCGFSNSNKVIKLNRTVNDCLWDHQRWHNISLKVNIQYGFQFIVMGL